MFATVMGVLIFVLTMVVSLGMLGYVAYAAVLDDLDRREMPRNGREMEDSRRARRIRELEVECGIISPDPGELIPREDLSPQLDRGQRRNGFSVPVGSEDVKYRLRRRY